MSYYDKLIPINNINLYSFVLKPEEHQLSNTCDFSKIYGTMNVYIGDRDKRISIIRPDNCHYCYNLELYKKCIHHEYEIN